MNSRVLKALIALSFTATTLIACDVGDNIEDRCDPLNYCQRNANGYPECMEGFKWADELDPDNYLCVPAETATSTPPSQTEDTEAPNSTPDDGCPPNSHRQGDSCYCDEGYVVNADGTGCIEGDSSPEGNCPPNSHWENDGCYCDEGFIVNEDRTACVRECETDLDCPGTDVCIDHFCRPPPCTPDSCEDGLICDETTGLCIADVGTLPVEPNLDCVVLPSENCSDTDTSCIPSWQCSGPNCGNLTYFDPRLGDHYWDYPLNGETTSNQYRSFIREDVKRLVKYASAWVRCMSTTWSFGNGGELGLGDMSETNGDIPGTSVGSPGHPPGTHVNGHDMDIGYYQISAPDNKLRSVCDHIQNGQDQYRCISEPTDLDLWRTALVLAKMHDNPNLRVIGVDGKIGELVESAITQMCSHGWISGNPCTNLKIAYEITDQGMGWYRFHHHHFHISVSGSKSQINTSATQCLTPSCTYEFRDDPRHLIYPALKPFILE